VFPCDSREILYPSDPMLFVIPEFDGTQGPWRLWRIFGGQDLLNGEPVKGKDIGRAKVKWELRLSESYWNLLPGQKERTVSLMEKLP